MLASIRKDDSVLVLERPPASFYMATMQQTMIELEQRINSLQFQSNAFARDISIPQTDYSGEIQDLYVTLEKHNRMQDRKLQETKKMFQESINDLMTSNRLKDSLRQNIRAQMTTEIRHEIASYLRDRMPVAPEVKLQETNKELEKTRILLVNSQARTRNASIMRDDLDEPLEPILKMTGKRSSLYPADLRSLLSYEVEDLNALLRDYELEEDDGREENLDSFMEFIGIRR